jgi:hypothetical protein
MIVTPGATLVKGDENIVGRLHLPADKTAE